MWVHLKRAATTKITVEMDEDTKKLVEEVCEPLDRRAPNAIDALEVIAKKKLQFYAAMKQVGFSVPESSVKMKILEIYEYLINNVEEFYELDDRSKSSENDYVSAIMPILQILLRGNTNLLRKTGETTAEATKRAQAHIREKYGTDLAANLYGRKVDMLIARTKDASWDLSAFEWKKHDVSDKQLVLQLSKNISYQMSYP